MWTQRWLSAMGGRKTDWMAERRKLTTGEGAPLAAGCWSSLSDKVQSPMTKMLRQRGGFIASCGRSASNRNSLVFSEAIVLPFYTSLGTNYLHIMSLISTIVRKLLCRLLLPRADIDLSSSHLDRQVRTAASFSQPRNIHWLNAIPHQSRQNLGCRHV